LVSDCLNSMCDAEKTEVNVVDDYFVDKLLP